MTTSETAATLQLFASDVQAFQQLQQEYKQKLNEIFSDAVEAVEAFGKLDSGRSSWLNRSKYSPLLRSYAVTHGHTQLWVSDKGDYVFEVEDSYDSWDQVIISPAQLADFANTLEGAYQAAQ